MADDAERLRLRWHFKGFGCLLPVGIIATVLFGVAAVTAELAADMAGHRGLGFIHLTEAVTLRGVNLPLGALALYSGFETFRLAWRWADEHAAWTSPAGLHFHGSLFRAAVPWHELRSVRTATRLRRNATVAVLVVERTDGRRIEVRGIEAEEAERFARAVQERAGR